MKPLTYPCLFLDTEFTSLDFPKPISIGLVLDRSGKSDSKTHISLKEPVEEGIWIGECNGLEYFYAELKGWKAQDCSQFCQDEVLPHLQGSQGAIGAVKEGLRTWLGAAGGATLIIDSMEYDHAILMRLLGERGRGDHRFIEPVVLPIENTAYTEAFEDYFWNKWEELPRHHALNDALAARAGTMKLQAHEG